VGAPRSRAPARSDVHRAPAREPTPQPADPVDPASRAHPGRPGPTQRPRPNADRSVRPWPERATRHGRGGRARARALDGGGRGASRILDGTAPRDDDDRRGRSGHPPTDLGPSRLGRIPRVPRPVRAVRHCPAPQRGGVRLQRLVHLVRGVRPALRAAVSKLRQAPRTAPRPRPGAERPSPSGVAGRRRDGRRRPEVKLMASRSARRP
jgi:hypothetical protein